MAQHSNTPPLGLAPVHTLNTPRDRHRLSVQHRQAIDRLLSALPRPQRTVRLPLRLMQSLQVLRWVRSRLARIDELLCHPERIVDPGELAALLIHTGALSAIASEAMIAIDRNIKPRSGAGTATAGPAEPFTSRH